MWHWFIRPATFSSCESSGYEKELQFSLSIYVGSEFVTFSPILRFSDKQNKKLKFDNSDKQKKFQLDNIVNLQVCKSINFFEPLSFSHLSLFLLRATHESRLRLECTSLFFSLL